jgi:pilus assembly protein CpaB
MRSNSNVMILAVAIVLGVVAAVLARNWLASHATLSQTRLGTIVVAASPLPFATQLTPQNTAEIPWTTAQIPNGAFATKQELFKDGRRTTLAQIAQNEPVLRTKVTAPNQPATLSSMLSSGKRAVTVRVDDVRGVAGFIQPGDLVDVVLIQTEAESRSNNSFSEVILQSAKVLAIDQVTGERTDKPTVAKAVTLEVSIEDAQKILLATNIGRLSLVLREPAQGHTDSVQRVTEADLGTRVPESKPFSTPPPPAPDAKASAPPPPESGRTRHVTVWHGMRPEEYNPPIYTANDR